jgi:hypothetical protein
MWAVCSASEEESEAECSSDSGSWTSEVNGRNAKPRLRKQRMGYKKYDDNYGRCYIQETLAIF